MMRPAIRSLLASASIALIALPALAGSALAASGSGVSEAYVVDDAWCWPSKEAPSYCFEVDGKFQFVNNAAVSVATGTIRTHTIAYAGGQPVSESWEQTVDQWRTDRQGDSAILEIGHTRFVSGDQACTAFAVLRISDYEVVVDDWHVVCR